MGAILSISDQVCFLGSQCTVCRVFRRHSRVVRAVDSVWRSRWGVETGLPLCEEELVCRESGSGAYCAGGWVIMCSGCVGNCPKCGVGVKVIVPRWCVVH